MKDCKLIHYHKQAQIYYGIKCKNERLLDYKYQVRHHKMLKINQLIELD